MSIYCCSVQDITRSLRSFKQSRTKRIVNAFLYIAVLFPPHSALVLFTLMNIALASAWYPFSVKRYFPDTSGFHPQSRDFENYAQR